MREYRGKRIISSILIVVMFCMMIGNHISVMDIMAETVAGQEKATPSDASVNASLKTKKQGDVSIMVISDTADYTAGGELSLDIYVKNNTRRTVENGILSIEGTLENVRLIDVDENGYDISSDEEALLVNDLDDDTQPEEISDNRVEGMYLQPGQMIHLRMEGTIADEDMGPNSQNVRFTFSGKKNWFLKAKAKQTFYYNVDGWNIKEVETASASDAGTAYEVRFRVEGGETTGEEAMASPSDCVVSLASGSNVQCLMQCELETELKIKDLTVIRNNDVVTASFLLPEKVAAGVYFGKISLKGTGSQKPMASSSGFSIEVAGEAADDEVVLAASVDGLEIEAYSLGSDFTGAEVLTVEKRDGDSAEYTEAAELLEKHPKTVTAFSLYEVTIRNEAGEPVKDGEIEYRATYHNEAAGMDGLALKADLEEASGYDMMLIDGEKKQLVDGIGQEVSNDDVRAAFMTGSRAMLVLATVDDTIWNGDITIGEASVISPETVKVGETQTVNIRSAVSNSAYHGKVYFRIDLAGDFGERVQWDPAENWSYDEDGNGYQLITDADGKRIQLNWMRDGEGNSYLWYCLEEGATLSFSLNFLTKNGVSGAHPHVELEIFCGKTEDDVKRGENLEPALVPSDDADETRHKAQGSADWVGEFAWNGPVKTVNPAGNLEIVAENDGKGTLNKNLTYTVSGCYSSNRDSVGNVFTDEILFTDTLTLPEGITFPDGCEVLADGENRIIGVQDHAGSAIYELTSLNQLYSQFGKENVAVTGMSVGTDRRTLSYKVEIKIPVDQDTPADVQSIPNLTSTLYTSKLALSDVNVETKPVIKNEVVLDTSPYDPYRENIPGYTGRADVTTPLVKQEKVKVTKTNSTDGAAGANQEVPYTITVANTGLVDTTRNVTDKLPSRLYLTVSQIEAILGEGYIKNEGSGYWAVYTYTSKDGTIQIKKTRNPQLAGIMTLDDEYDYEILWKNQTVPAGETKQFMFSCTTKSEGVLQNGGNKISNTAYYGSEQGSNSLNIKRANVTVKKSHLGQENDFVNGALVTYTITIENTGNGAATNRTFTDTLPKGLILVDQDGEEILSSGTYEIGGKSAAVTLNQGNGTTTIVWTYDRIESGEKHVLTYRAKLDEKAMDQPWDSMVILRNTVNSTGDDLIYKKGKLSIDKVISEIVSADGSAVEAANPKSYTIQPGDTISYELSVENSSSLDVTLESLEDSLPYIAGTTGIWEEDENVFIVKGGNDDVSGFCNHAKENGYEFSGNKGIQKKATIVWKDVTIPAGKTLKQQIKLTFPKTQEELDAMFGEDSSQPMYNSFLVDGKHVEVEHKPEPPVEPAEAYIQKGVFMLGQAVAMEEWQGGQQKLVDKLFWNRQCQGGSLMYYPASADNEYVVYYCYIYNSGSTSLTVEKVVDILPDGVEYVGLPPSNVYSGQDFLAGSNSAQYEGWTQRSVFTIFVDERKAVASNPLNVSYSSNESTGQKLVFHVKEGNDKLVVNPNEMASFAYVCKVDKGLKAEDGLLNTVGVAFGKTEGGLKAGNDWTTIGDNFGLEPNDGSCTKLDNASDYDQEADQYDWLESHVTIYPIDSIVPGLQKSATATIAKDDLRPGANQNPDYGLINPDTNTGGKEELLNDNHEVVVSDVVRWDVEISNTLGQVTMHGYQVRDILESPYEIESAWFKPKDGDAIKIDLPQPLVENQTRKYLFEFAGEQYDIAAGSSATLILYTAIEAEKSINGSRLNVAELYNKQDYDASMVEKGNPKKNSSYESCVGTYLESSDYVNLMGDYATTSYKTIEEVGNKDNFAKGGIAGENYIEVEDATHLVRYTLTVKNSSTKKKPLDDFVLIDYLPEIGDHGTWDAINRRESEFAVTAAEQLDFEVLIYRDDRDSSPAVLKPVDEASENEGYILEYSDKTSYSGSDWNGERSGDWYDTPTAQTKSLRVRIVNRKLTGGQRIEVRFNGRIAEAAAPGEIAWNSFGYRYYDADDKSNEMYLTAAPPKVGVKIKERPILKKVVVDVNGNVMADQVSEEDFEFQIYEGALTEDELEGKSPIPNGTITLKQNEHVDLRGLLKTGTPYTIVESNQGSLEFVEFTKDGSSQGAGKVISFTYRGGNITITAVNRYEARAFPLPVTGGMGTAPFTIGGFAIMCLGIFMMIRYRLKEEEKKR